jgi:hypothetical protein
MGLEAVTDGPAWITYEYSGARQAVSISLFTVLFHTVRFGTAPAQQPIRVSIRGPPRVAPLRSDRGHRPRSPPLCSSSSSHSGRPQGRGGVAAAAAFPERAVGLTADPRAARAARAGSRAG